VDKTCDVIVIGAGGVGINTEPKSSNEKLLPGAR
jgi:succinate dehydrogenase/fumarate reductase flavoprotein subunit